MNEKQYQIIEQLSVVETEVWNFSSGDIRIIDPALPRSEYAVGIGLYLVPLDFCSKQ